MDLLHDRSDPTRPTGAVWEGSGPRSRQGAQRGAEPQNKGGPVLEDECRGHQGAGRELARPCKVTLEGWAVLVSSLELFLTHGIN